MITVKQTIINEVRMHQVLSWNEAGLWHGICGRDVDVSQSADVWRQKFPSQRLLLLNQEHGIKIVKAPNTTDEANKLLEKIPTADAWAGYVDDIPSGFVLGIKTADCAPVLMFSHSARFVVVAHCGWKSALLHLCARCIELACNNGVPVSSLEMVVAPCASVKNYEIGQEVKNALVEWIKEFNIAPSVIDGSLNDKGVLSKRGGKEYLNLPRLLEIEAIACGLDKNNIKSLDICTIENKDYFSVRREQMQCGRQVTFIGRQ